MANSDLFTLSAMLDALPKLRIPTARETNKEETPATPRKENQPLSNSCSCGSCAAINPQELVKLRMQDMYNFMTNSHKDTDDLFKEFISDFNGRELRRMATLLTSDSDYFVNIATDEYGSKRLQTLLGKSDDVDALLCDAILSRFLHVMTNKHASHMAVRAMCVFSKERQEVMYKYTLLYALHIACHQYGCIALNKIITDLDLPDYRNKLLDIVANNALFLSNDAYGNFVIQQVLKLDDLPSTYLITARLNRHYVDLSFKKHGSYIVERLLEASETSMLLVVLDLIKCDRYKLMRLARSEFGNFVVAKALRVTKEKHMVHLFWGLADKLMPYIDILRRSRGSNIALILESVI